ncbi:hypothetical protein KI387_042073, partial [Taxus chinensis]
MELLRAGCEFEISGGLREGFESVVSIALAAECLSKNCDVAAKEPVKEKNAIFGGSVGSRAWAEVVKTPPDKNVKPQAACDFKSTKDAEGVTHLQVPDGFLQRALEKTNLALVGKFLGARPNVDTIRNWAIRRWKPKGDLIITTMAKGFFLARFNLQYDVDSVLLGGPWCLGNMGLFLKKWYPGFNPFVENIHAIPIWCRLPGLPLHLWDDEILLHIAKSIGSPIGLDGPTRNRSRLAFSRFCVSIEMDQELPDNIVLQSKFGEWNQQIEYEAFKLRCSKCHRLGHFSSKCLEHTVQKLEDFP